MIYFFYQIIIRSNLNVDIFDIDNQHINDLLSYDVVEFIGGNPYYLLKVLNEVNAKDVLKQIVNEKILIGWSAGALVMTTSIGIINEFYTEMNEWNITDFKAMNLNNVQIVPHYSKFINKYNDFEERCNKYEQNNNCKLIRLNEGENMMSKVA